MTDDQQTLQVADQDLDTSKVEIEQPSLQGNAEHDEKESVVVEDNSLQQDTQAEHETQTKVDELDKREQNKISALEKERNEASETARKERFQRLLTLAQLAPQKADEEFKDNPKAYEEFRSEYQKVYGQSLPSHAEVYQQPNNNAVGGGTKQLTEDDVKRQVQQGIAVERAKEKLFQEIPDADPQNMQTVEEIEAASKRLAEAQAKAELTLSFRPDLSYQEALVMEYKSLPEVQNKLVQKARLEGEITGKAKALGSNAGIGSSPSGSAPTIANTLTVPMSSAQKTRYEQLKAKDPKIASYYARSIAGKL